MTRTFSLIIRGLLCRHCMTPHNDTKIKSPRIATMLKYIILPFTMSLFPEIISATPEIGKPAPEFSLHDVDGKLVKLSDFKGKIVVLEWINEGCPFVKGHYENGHIPSMQEYYTAVGVVWLTINS